MNVFTTTTAQARLRVRFIFYLSIFVLLLFLSELAHNAYAQASSDTSSTPANASAPGTLPPGTIPEHPVYLPLLVQASATLTNLVTFEALSVQGPPIDHTAAINGDLNLSLRSYISKTAALTLIDINGNIDSDAPQLAGLFSPPRLPTLMGAYQVYDWNWNCSPDGCRGAVLTQPEITLLEMAVTPGESLYIPTRNSMIFSGGYKALVLYAEGQRITFVYTRQDTPAIGYMVHIEDIAVAPALLALYEQLNAAGRSKLPALHTGEVIGVAAGATIKVAIRDTGSFLDPRSRKDWWKGF